jgi:hypothetical protein
MSGGHKITTEHRRDVSEAISLKEELSAEHLSSAGEFVADLIRYDEGETFASKEVKVESFIHAVGVQNRNSKATVVVYANRADRVRHNIPTVRYGTPIIVVESLPAILAIACSAIRDQRQRPIQLGISGGHKNVGYGTVGGFCRENEDSSLLVLSNNHVFANLNKGSRGDELYQPGSGHGGSAQDTFATLYKYETLHLDGITDNRVDAALGRVNDDIGYKNEICSIGRPRGIREAAEQMDVRKHGARTGLTRGRIEDISYDTVVGTSSGVAKFTNQIRITKEPRKPHIALPGDSGSLIVTGGSRNIRAVGLLFACGIGGSYAIANPLQAVLDTLMVELVVGNI